ncbi:MAG: hypothetical protein ABSG53_12060 [Thermoguttaceae bacterium]
MSSPLTDFRASVLAACRRYSGSRVSAEPVAAPARFPKSARRCRWPKCGSGDWNMMRWTGCGPQRSADGW